jgi:hypothetical protein
VIEDEVLETCVDGALLWIRWALRRLQFLLIGDLQPLLADLRGSTFRLGELAIRLQAANLPDLLPDDQRLLGVAVGQRAALNTFTVRIDGIEACGASGTWLRGRPPTERAWRRDCFWTSSDRSGSTTKSGVPVLLPKCLVPTLIRLGWPVTLRPN